MALPSKICSLSQAVSAIPDGAVVGVGGNINARRPMALALEIMAQEKRGLTLVAMTAGLACDLLIGAGCVKTLRSSYTGLEIFGMAPNFRRAAESGELEVVEETEMTIASGLRAVMAQVPFLPARVMQGTDLMKVRPDIKTVACPYTGRELTALPALKPDVALIHALAADSQGNAVLGGNLGCDLEMAATAELTIVSAEEIVDHETVVARGVDLMGLCVQKVAAAPGGARPTSCHPAYGLDGQGFLDYMEACGRSGGFAAYVNRLRGEAAE